MENQTTISYMQKIALVGYGYWGPNLLRNFFETPNCEVLYCCDSDISKLKIVRKRFPSIITTTDYREVLSDPEISAVVIATPTRFHFPLAKDALEAGKDVLIEKPMTLNLLEAKKLVAIASKKKRILMVDHTFLYNEAVRKIKEIVDSGNLGDILYIDSVRANLGLFQNDSNVIFDLATHDFSIISYLLNKKPLSVQAYGKSHVNKQEDVAHVISEYQGGMFAHLHVSWLSPLKVRTMSIIGTKRMLIYNDVNPSEKICVYEKGVSIEGGLTKKLEEQKISYRSGDAFLPNIKSTEALSLMASDFINSISKRSEPLSGGKLGASVVELLEKSTESLRTGKKIRLTYGSK